MTTVADEPTRHPLVGELLAVAEARPYSDGELSRALDVHYRTIQEWRRGRVPRARHQRAITRWLKEESEDDTWTKAVGP